MRSPQSDEYAVPAPSNRNRMPLEIEDHDRLAVLDEKTEGDPLAPETDAEEFGTDDTGIEEEVDPFGDKWEG